MTPSSDFDDQAERWPPRTEPTFADVLNGFSLDSRRQRRRFRSRFVGDEDEVEEQPAEEWSQEQPADKWGEEWADEWADEWAEHSPAREWRPEPRYDIFDPSPSEFGSSEEWRYPVDELSDAAAIVRPYALTGGRTRASVHLRMETLVSTSDRGMGNDAPVQLEHRTVAELCRNPHAVAEVAAKLSMPLGVARVLLSDMADLGLIVVHQAVAEDDDTAAQLMVMERVLSGLRRL